jgi:hypothetical protein
MIYYDSMEPINEEHIEYWPLERLQDLRETQTKILEQFSGIHGVTRAARIGFPVLGAANVAIISLGDMQVSTGEASQTIGLCSVATIVSHGLYRWSSSRKLHAGLELRASERVIDRRLGIDPELSD